MQNMDENPAEEIIEICLEEGEVSNDSDDYTPLERPANYSSSNINIDSRFPQALEINESDSEEQQTTEPDSDSDSTDVHSKRKKPKIKLIPKLQRHPLANHKYNIWSTRVQEDVLSETLNSCDVTKKDRSRDVESYDYVVSSRYKDMINGVNNKRTRDDRKNVHCRLGKRLNDLVEKCVEGKSRQLLDLATTLDNTEEEIAKDIANKLYEEKEELIVKVLNIAGKQKCFDIFQQTKELEANGGMLIMNQTRRRTPGGVFLYIVRTDEDITREQKDKIFNDERKILKKNSKEMKKQKMQKWKKNTAEEKAKLLPELLTRAEKLMENRLLKEVDDAVVINPPPTPETDVHENSCDATDNLANVRHEVKSTVAGRHQLTTYNDDFLDLVYLNDEMDLF